MDRATSRSIDQDIAQALAADAAFLEDPALSLGEGALQPLEGAYEEGYELPALSAGGTISEVQALSWAAVLCFAKGPCLLAAHA